MSARTSKSPSCQCVCRVCDILSQASTDSCAAHRSQQMQHRCRGSALHERTLVSRAPESIPPRRCNKPARLAEYFDASPCKGLEEKTRKLNDQSHGHCGRPSFLLATSTSKLVGVSATCLLFAMGQPISVCCGTSQQQEVALAPHGGHVPWQPMRTTRCSSNRNAESDAFRLHNSQSKSSRACLPTKPRHNDELAQRNPCEVKAKTTSTGSPNPARRPREPFRGRDWRGARPHRHSHPRPRRPLCGAAPGHTKPCAARRARQGGGNGHAPAA